MKTLLAYRPGSIDESLETFYNESYDLEVAVNPQTDYGFDEVVDENPEESTYLRDLADVSDHVLILADEKKDVDKLAEIVLEEDENTVVEGVSAQGVGKYETEKTFLPGLRSRIFNYLEG